METTKRAKLNKLFHLRVSLSSHNWKQCCSGVILEHVETRENKELCNEYDILEANTLTKNIGIVHDERKEHSQQQSCQSMTEDSLHLK